MEERVSYTLKGNMSSVYNDNRLYTECQLERKEFMKLAAPKLEEQSICFQRNCLVCMFAIGYLRLSITDLIGIL